MARLRALLPCALALACGACAPGPDPSTYGVPAATLAPVRLVPCPDRVAAAATAVRCPEAPR